MHKLRTFFPTVKDHFLLWLVRAAAFLFVILSVAPALKLDQIFRNSGNLVTVRAAASPSESGEVQMVNIPYYTESEGMNSTLTLNNNMPEVVTTNVTLFNRKGESFIVPPIE